MSAPATPWAVIASPTDPEMYAVQGVYLVADCLPIEDARLIAAAPDMLAALVATTKHSDGLIEEGHYTHRVPRIQSLYEMCAAAIAKVSGE